MAKKEMKEKEYEEKLELIVGEEQTGKIVDKDETKLKELVKANLTSKKQENWVEKVETSTEDTELNENQIRIFTTDNYIILAEILDNGKINIEEIGPDDGEPYPKLILEQLPLSGAEDEKIQIKVTATVTVEKTNKTTKVDTITLKGEEARAYEDGMIYEVEGNGEYTFKATTDYGKSKSKTIKININEPEEEIEISAEPRTARNTEKTSPQNGVETGLITVTIDYKETDLTKQYKIGNSEWQTITESKKEIAVDKNIAIIARYHDGINGYKVTTYNVQNVDNTAPEEFEIKASNTTNSITVEIPTTTDTASEGATEGTEGIARYEYRINEGTWQTSNEFKNLTTGTYKVQAKAIDKAGNETISTNIEELTLGTISVEDIEIDATPKTERNTLAIGIQNEVETGPITVTITYGNSSYTREYKIGNGEWKEVKTDKETFTVAENVAIVARYSDGTNGFETETYNIQNVDNVKPTFTTYNATVSGKTITATGTATDTASEGVATGIAGILRYEYKIDNNGYKTTNTFEISTAGTYKIYIKAIDKAGNETVVDKDVTITNYTVSYDANGGTGAPGAQTEISGVNLTLSNTTPTRTGYTFAGWSTNKTATTAEYGKGATYTANKITTLYAVWTANTNTKYVVVHQLMNLDGTTYTTDETENLTGTTGASVTPNTKTYTGFTAPAKQTVTIGADGKTTVTYKYTRNKYTYTLGTATGVSTSGSTASGTYYYGAPIILNATVSSGYTWNNWVSSNTNLAGNHTNANVNGTMPAGNLTMTPKATLNTYTIAYTLNGGSVATANPTSYNVTSNAITLNNPTRAGYTFAGWTGSNGTTKQTSVTIAKGSTGNKTYTANWTLNTYKITYNLNGGSVATANPTSYNVTSNAITLNNPTRAGYTFAGWTGSNGTTKQTSVTIAKESTGDKTYTANWTANTNTKYVVVHQLMNLDGTTYTTDVTENLTGTTGASVTPNTKTYTGFTAPAKQTVTIGADGKTTVTYKYTRNKYAYTLGTATGVTTTGSTASGTYYYGAPIILKATVSAGYTWNNWVSSNTSLAGNHTNANVNGTMPAGNLTMTPKATINSYKITYNANGGSVSTASTTANYNAAITMPTPTRSYTVAFDVNSGSACANQTATYTFNGWYTAASGGTKRAYTKMPAYNETVYAQWASKSITLPTPTRSGYIFNGWYSTETSNNGSGTLIGAGGASYTPSANVTLYARWTANNTAPTAPTTSVTSRGTTTFVVNAKSTDSNSDKITYKLYVKTSSASSYTLKATSESTASGTAVNLTASGLTSYTVYNYYVTATDTKNATTNGTEKTTGTACDDAANPVSHAASYCDDGYVSVSYHTCYGNGCSICGCTSTVNNPHEHGQGNPHPCSHGIPVEHYYCTTHGFMSTDTSSSTCPGRLSHNNSSCTGKKTVKCTDTVETVKTCTGTLSFTTSSPDRGQTIYFAWKCSACGDLSYSGYPNETWQSGKAHNGTSTTYSCSTHGYTGTLSYHNYTAGCDHGYTTSHYYCSTHGYIGSEKTHSYCKHGKLSAHYPN